jgi:polygalacturonase
MNILKSTITLFTAVLFSVCAVAQSGKYPDLYKGIEFQMPKVQEPVIPKYSVSITDFGAVSGGQELCTKAFADAIEAVSKKGGGRVVIPRGTWLTGPITLKSNIELYSEIGALVIFSKNKDLYPLVETNFEGFNTFRCMSPINGRNLENIAITGHGVFDGSGEAWRAVKKDKLTESQWKTLVASGGIVGGNGKTWYPSQQFIDGEKLAEMNVPRSIKTKAEFEKIKDFLRPVMVSLISCKKVLFDGPTFQNSPAWCIHPLMCEDFTFRNMTIRNPWFSQNGDGIDIESCKNSLIHDSTFDVGDDGICIKSGKDKDGRDRKMPNENLIVKNCVVFHGHGGVTVGSEMSSGVKNLHVSNCTFIGTDVGLRFKSNRGRGGVVEDIFISNVEMINIPTQAISFNLYYSGRSASEDLEAGENGQAPKLLPVTEETPQFKNITIKNVNCKGAMLGIQLQGLPEMNLENVSLEDITMEADQGLVCNDATNVRIKNLTLLTKKTPVADFKNSRDVVIDGLHTTAAVSLVIQVSGVSAGSTIIKNAGILDFGQQVVVGKEVKKGAVQLVK